MGEASDRFNIGDRVRRIDRPYASIRVGDIGTIYKMSGASIYLQEQGGTGFDYTYFERAKPTNEQRIAERKEAMNGNK